MKQMLPALAAVTLVLVAGVVHGFWTDRWRAGPRVEAAVPTSTVCRQRRRLEGRADAERSERQGHSRPTLPALRAPTRKDRRFNLAGPGVRSSRSGGHSHARHLLRSQRLQGRPQGHLHTARASTKPRSSPPRHSTPVPPTRRTCASSGRGSRLAAGRRRRTRASPSRAGCLCSTNSTSSANMVADVPLDQDPCTTSCSELLPALQKALEPGTV